MSRLWLFLAVALPVLASLLASMSTVDLTYHLRAGDEILRSGAIPTADAWTFTAAGEPWVDQQWGAQVILALGGRLGSWTGLALLRAVLSGLIFGSLVLICRRRCLDARTTALLVLVAFLVAAPAMALRPQLLGMACFAVVLLLVSDRRAHPGRLWAVPVIVALWANLHGSFFLGPLVLGLAWLEDLHDRVARPHRALLVALVSVAAACLTPSGPWIWAYAVGLSTNPAVTSRITEWQPTSIRDASGLLFFASAFGVVALIARRGTTTSWPTLAWLAVFATIALYAQRGVAWWPLAAVAAIAGTLIPAATDSTEPATPTGMRRLNALVAGLLFLVGVGLLPAWRPTDPATSAPVAVLTDAPAGVTAALRDLAATDDRVFNPQPWGSWLEYAAPEVKVAIDSRIEFFPVAVWEDYEAVAGGVDGWEARLDDWSVDWVVVEAEDAAFRARLEDAGWVAVFDDDEASLFRRQTGSRSTG